MDRGDRGIICCPRSRINKQKEGNKAGEDLLGSRWLPESSLPSPGMKGDREIREGEGGWREEK